MSPIDTIFVDKGGVLIDLSTLGAQWRRLIGEFLSPRLGGTPEAWGAANIPAFERQWARFSAVHAAREPADIRGFFTKDAPTWFLDMCDGVGIAPPAEAEAERIAADTIRYVNAHLEVHVPRVLDTLRSFRRRGVTLHIASADSHNELVEFLGKIGARELFDRVYGSDLVNTLKFGPEYYRAVLADSGADANRAAVVDDSEAALSWARECGLRTFLVDRRAGEEFDDAVARTFGEIARAID